MRIYLSGPISNNPNHIADFESAEEDLKHQGHEVINPVLLGYAYPNLTYAEYMKIDLALLEMCDAIHMLDGWEDSTGAKLEFHVAMVWKKQIV